MNWVARGVVAAGAALTVSLAALTSVGAGPPVDWTLGVAEVPIGNPTPAPESQAAVVKKKTRILIVGDSMTQGSAGDYTWRRFLDKHLRKSRVAFDFVGPRDGVFAVTNEPLDPDHPPKNTNEYLDKTFDADHGALWGNSIVWPLNQTTLAARIKQFQPAVVIHMLGYNDLAWFGHSAQTVAAAIRQQIIDARAVDPSIKFVVGQMMVDPKRVPNLDVAGLNKRIVALATQLRTTKSPITVAKFPSNYVGSSETVVGDTWDLVHPDTSGQVKVAAAVGDALSRLGIGRRYPRPLAIPKDGLRQRSKLMTRPGVGSVLLTWDGPPGSTSHDIWMREVGPGEKFRRIADRVAGESFLMFGLLGATDYEFKIVARKWWIRSANDMFSPVMRRRTLPLGASVPGEVSGVKLTPGDRSLSISWQGVAKADRYLVWVGRPGYGWKIKSVTGMSTTVTGLASGLDAMIAIQPENEVGVGPLGDTYKARIS